MEIKAAGHMFEKRKIESVNENFEAVEKGEVSAQPVFDFGVSEPFKVSDVSG